MWETDKLPKFLAFILAGMLSFSVLALAEETEDSPDLTEVDDETALMDEFALLQEEEIVLSAAKHKQKIGFSPSEVIVITRKDIEESGAVGLIDLLRRYPVVHVYEFDPLHPNAEIRTSKYILLMVDGREVNLDIFEAPFFELMPLSIHDIERIEIVMGPNSALYGANAVAAVINVMTRKPQTGFSTDISVAAGQHGGTIVGCRLSGGAGPWAAQGKIGINRSNSWMNRNLLAKDITRADVTLRLEIPDGSLTVDGGLMTGGGQIYGVIGTLDFDSFILGHTRAKLEWNQLKLDVYWYGIRTVFDVDIDLVHPNTGITLARLPTNHLDGDTVLFAVQYDLDLFENNLLISGVDVRQVNYRGDNLAGPDIAESRVGVFLHDEHRFSDQLMLTISARFDWNSTTDIAVSPRAALVYQPVKDHFLRLSGGTAFRKPTLLESSVNLKVEAEPGFREIKTLFEEKGLSNPELNNESLTAVEVGYRGSLLEKRLRLGADVYLGLNRSTINFASDIRFNDLMQIDLPNSKIGYGNFGRDDNVVGVHASVEADALEALSLFARGSYRHQWYADDNSTVRYQPHFLLAIGGVARPASGLAVYLSAVHVGYRISEIRDPESSLAPVIRTPIPASTYLLASVTYRLSLGIPQLHLGVNLFNPFGGRFREAQGTTDSRGENYGGEFVAPRAMLTARMVY